MSTGLVSAGMVEGSTVEVACTFLADCCWEVQMWKNGVSINRRNSFSIEDLSPFKEEQQGLLKQHDV